MSLLATLKQIGLGFVQNKLKTKRTAYKCCVLRNYYISCVFRKPITNSTTLVKEKEKIRFVGKWLRYWEELIKDYNDVLKETFENAKKYPRKTFLISSFLGLVLLCLETNPDDLNYRDYFLTCSNDVSLVDSAVRNTETEHFIKTVESCYNLGILRRLNLGIMSVLWIDNYNNQLGLFKSNCSYLQPQYLSSYNRVVDIGFFGKWWRLDKLMQDYDVHFEEWVGDKVSVAL